VHPVLLHIPLPGGHELPVPAYGTMLMTGFLLAVWMARRRAAALGLQKVEIFDMGIFAIVGGVLGARLLHVILEWRIYFPVPITGSLLGWLGHGLLGAISTWNGGLVYYGGLGGGMLALWLYTRRRKIPFIDALDFVAAPAAVGLALTRVGCFLNGCCFGHESHLPWAVTYPKNSHVYADLDADGCVTYLSPYPVHPTQLYETVAALAMAALIWWLVWPRRKFVGQAAFTFGTLYAVWRFLNEFLRGDTYRDGPALEHLTVFQYISIALIAVFGAAYLAAWWLARAPFRPPPPDPDAAAEGGEPAA
jgi:phosphatidylglycerol:prolipoprotein diacylglycerol transferase